MGFMKPEKLLGRWYVLEDNGTTYYPFGDLTADDLLYSSGKDATVAITFGYGVRLSAPGYLDCTDWEVYETQEEANARIQEWEDEEEEIEAKGASRP